MLKVGVLVSGGGTNLQAILDAIDSGKITNAEVSLVISNNPGAYALERAKKHNIEAVCISPKQFENREEFHKALLAKLKEQLGILLCLVRGGRVDDGGLANVLQTELVGQGKYLVWIADEDDVGYVVSK